jgi:hypothetical protein
MLRPRIAVDRERKRKTVSNGKEMKRSTAWKRILHRLSGKVRETNHVETR